MNPQTSKHRLEALTEYQLKIMNDNFVPSTVEKIVKAVNCHDDLVEALENIKKIAIGFDTSHLTKHQRNSIALIFQNTNNGLDKAKGGE